MSSNSIPPTLKELLTRLEFLTMIKKKRKLCMHDNTFVNSDSWIGACKRYLTGENRHDMISHINTIVERSIQAIKEYNGTEFLSLILDKLLRARNGIANLKVTYKNAPDIVSQLVVCIDNINLQLQKNRDSLSDPSVLESPSNKSSHDEDDDGE
jgi:hypothetical protein